MIFEKTHKPLNDSENEVTPREHYRTKTGWKWPSGYEPSGTWVSPPSRLTCLYFPEAHSLKPSSISPHLPACLLVECSAKETRGVKEVIEEGARVALGKTKPAQVRTLDPIGSGGGGGGGSRGRKEKGEGRGCVIA